MVKTFSIPRNTRNIEGRFLLIVAGIHCVHHLQYISLQYGIVIMACSSLLVEGGQFVLLLGLLLLGAGSLGPGRLDPGGRGAGGLTHLHPLHD